jgi:peptidylprolyl isomerase
MLATACGDDSEDSTTTTTATSGADGGSNGTGGAEASTPEAKAVEERGEPTVEAVEGPVTELVVIDDVEGTGTEVQPGDTVTAQYVGAVAETGDVFQSSWELGGAIQFPLDGVIQGWSEGLVGMKAGGRRTLVIPAEMAYGAAPPGGSGIPADAALVFTIDLVSVN